MKETNIPEYFKADIPFNPNIDIDVLQKNIEYEVRRWFPLWKDCDLKISVTIAYNEHVYRILYGPKRRSEIDSLVGLRLANIIRKVYHTLMGKELDSFPYGWGHKEDGSVYTHNELYTRDDED